MAYSRERNGRWYACWVDLNGKQKSKACGSGPLGKKLAHQLAEQQHAKLVLGVAEDDHKPKTWEQFIRVYTDRKLSRIRDSSHATALSSIKNFSRISCPSTVNQIDELMIDRYISTRSLESGRKRGELISPETINRELRTVRAMLNAAKRWRFIDYVPEVEFLRCDKTEPEFISSAEFSKLYRACRQSVAPDSVLNVSDEDAWKALILFIYMTGWRINQTLQLEWADLDINSGMVFSPAKNNKGWRDISCQLHPIVLDHLAPLQASFSQYVFFKPSSSKRLYPEFHRLQGIAEIKPNKKEWYGFHDLRRGFASNNAANLDLFELQMLMQHKSLETTKRYVSMAHRSDTVLKLKVPNIKRKSKEI